MSQVIKFLEAMGGSAMALSDREFIAAVAALDVDGPVHAALTSKDHQGLNHLLGGRGEMIFGVFAAEEDCAATVSPVLLAA